jgi:L-fuculokinase
MSALPARSDELLGVIDIGKTHARFISAAPDGGVLIESQREVAPSADTGLIRQLDLAGIEAWLIAVLKSHPHRDRIRTLVPIAHGAAAVLLDGAEQVLAAPDYEDERFEQVADDYRELRDPFDLTYSPFLPLGLNLGRQLFFLSRYAPELMQRVRRVLLYPQYWAWRLSGVAASELTSFGCHSDLWRPLQQRPTELSIREGWDRHLPPLRAAGDTLGTIRADFARRTGLPADCRVLCGLHDSNASFLAHLSTRTEEHFAVVSSGTWTVVMAKGTNLSRVREPLDMLANIDALGAPIATARFMGGREYEVIAGKQGMQAAPSIEDLGSLLSRQVMALPSFSSAGGPFAHVEGRLISTEHLNTRQRASLASLYLALMTDYLLDLLDVRGAILVDGPLARNPVFLQVLSALRPAASVRVDTAAVPAVTAASYLAFGARSQESYIAGAEGVNQPSLKDYRARWRQVLARE